MYQNNKLSVGLSLFGLFIVVATHVYMLVGTLPPEQMMGHAIINLVASVCIFLGWTTHKA